MSVRQAAEDLAFATTPVPVGVSGLTFLGITLQDWVFVGTALLLLFQLIVFIPKVRDAFRSLMGKEESNGSSEGDT